jgi:anti-sigma factor RsiW
MGNDTTHDAYTGRLSDYIDDELDLREHAEIEQHVARCASCRAVVSDLRAVAARAASLPSRAPDQDLWPGVREQIGLQSRHPLGFAPRARRRFSFTLPQLAAAGIALMVLSGGLVWVARSGDPRADFPAVDAVATADPAVTARGSAAVAPVMHADPQFQGAVEDLERLLQEGRSRLDPETIRILEHNLASIDAAIEQSRRALEKDPANTFLNNHLAAARQRKLALLRRATALTQGS